MNCPVCDRTLAATLSICPSCGAMMNDSVREELQDKISVASRKIKIEFEDDIPEMPVAPVQTRTVEPRAIETRKVEAKAPEAPEPAPQRERGGMTGEIRAARKTSPILVEFQAKSSALPDWRLQMQNAVRQRREAAAGTMAPPAVERPTLLRATGSTGVAVPAQTGFVSDVQPASAPAAKSPVFNNAKRRIEESRKKFLVHEGGSPGPIKPHTRKGVKTFPIAVPEPAKTPEIASEPVVEAVSEVTVVDEVQERSLPLFDAPLDTNKLPALEDVVTTEEEAPIAVEESPMPAELEADADLDIFDDELIIDDEDLEAEVEVEQRTAVEVEEVAHEEEEETEVEYEDDYVYEYDEEYEAEADEENELEYDYEDEIEDLAPITMRFNAGLFDLIIGSFTSILILSPFILSGGKWLTSTGVIAFGVTLAIVMFIYMTASVTFTGRTIGMRVFSLEMIDVEENEYPSFHQAALSASIYLASLALGGLGFVTALFNAERRALHDLLSGTIIVKEY